MVFQLSKRATRRLWQQNLTKLEIAPLPKRGRPNVNSAHTFGFSPEIALPSNNRPMGRCIEVGVAVALARGTLIQGADDSVRFAEAEFGLEGF